MRASISTCRTGMSSVADQAADVGEPLGRVLQQQRVGALVDRDAAALGQQRALALRLDQRGEIGGLGVVDLQELGAQRRQLLHRSARASSSCFSRAAISAAGATMITLSFAAHVEALGAQHDVERLVPRHVLQAQRDVALHRVADDDVLAADVGQQLQHRARLDVLEVQRQALALVVLPRLELGAPPCDDRLRSRSRTRRRTDRRAARSRRWQ